jgi:hypothetical protein
MAPAIQAVQHDMAPAGPSSGATSGTTIPLSNTQGAPDSGKNVQYINVSSADGEKGINPRGTKTFENNMPAFKFSKILAACALAIVIFGLVFLTGFMRRRSRRA